MAGGGGEALIQGRGLFQGYTVFTFSKILLHVIYLFLQTSTMIVNFYRFEDTFTVEGNRHFCFEFIIISPLLLCQAKYSFNPLTPMSDQDRISPLHINTISTR